MDAAYLRRAAFLPGRAVQAQGVRAGPWQGAVEGYPWESAELSVLGRIRRGLSKYATFPFFDLRPY